MDANEILRIVDAIHRDKNIDKEIVFEGIEAALVSAAKKHFGETEDIVVEIDRSNGAIHGTITACRWIRRKWPNASGPKPPSR